MQLVSSDRSSLHCDALLELIPILLSIKTAISALKIQRQRRGGEIWLCCTNYEKKLGDINFFLFDNICEMRLTVKASFPLCCRPCGRRKISWQQFHHLSQQTSFLKNILTILTTVIIVKVVIIVTILTIFHNKGPQTESFLKNLRFKWACIHFHCSWWERKITLLQKKFFLV